MTNQPPSTTSSHHPTSHDSPAAGREHLLMRALVDLADTLVSDYDPVEVMHRLVEHITSVLAVDAAGLLLADSTGHLHLAASSEHSMHVLEVLQVDIEQGPCTDAYRTGEVVQSADMVEQSARWPRWAPSATDAGFHAVAALPLRLRERRIGALNLLRREASLLSEVDLRAAQALADIATIGVLQQRAIADSHTVTHQLQNALDSRIPIEQAKGVLTQRLGITPEAAFTLLRTHARSHGLKLDILAADLVAGRLDLPTTPTPTQSATRPRSTDRRR